MIARSLRPRRPRLLTSRHAVALLLALTLLLPGLIAAPATRAASCTVTSTADSGDNTLRAAIDNTNNFFHTVAVCTTITFALPGAGPWTIALTSGLAINAEPRRLGGLTIQGPGSGALTIRGDSTFRLLTVDSPGEAISISGLTLTRGKAVGGNFGGDLRVVHVGTLALTGVALTAATADAGLSGAGGYIGSGTATLTNVTISGNSAPGSVTYEAGAGLFVDDYWGNTDVTISGSAIAGNAATSYDGGGLAMVNDQAGRTLAVRLDGTDIRGNHADNNDGGGIANVGGTLTLTNSSLSGNQAASVGGGLFNSLGTVTLTGSTLIANQASVGGGLYNDRGTVTLTGTTVRDNEAGDGGGLYNSIGTLTLTNSTVSGNTASGIGGGLYNNSGTATLTGVTLVNNKATTFGGGVAATGAAVTPAATHLKGSIVAGNLHGTAPEDCKTADATNAPLISDGDNLVGNGTGCPIGGIDTVLTGALATALNPTLADNGGPTKTHNLVPGSPALDRIPPARCTLTTDQRNVTRPQNGMCDIGAVEYAACGQRFGDVPGSDPACAAVEALASRGIINGCDASAIPPLFCPNDSTLREQMAALIVRAMPGWQAETWPNSFTDQTDDAELMRRVGTLQHYGVVGGYTTASCVAQGKTPPCYGPLDPVLRAQAISFVTRAMVAKGYWAQQPTDPTLYGGVLVGTGHEQDATTYWHYTEARGGVPDYPKTGGFPLDEAAPRAWFARLLWTAIQGTPAAP